MLDVSEGTVRLPKRDSAFRANQQCVSDKPTVRFKQTNSAFRANQQCVSSKPTVRLGPCTMEYSAKGLDLGQNARFRVIGRSKLRTLLHHLDIPDWPGRQLLSSGFHSTRSTQPVPPPLSVPSVYVNAHANVTEPLTVFVYSTLRHPESPVNCGTSGNSVN